MTVDLPTPALLGHESMDASAPWTLPEALEHAARIEEHGCFRGLRFRGRRGELQREVSWRELRRRVLSASCRLAAEGIGAGDRVALILQTSPDFFESFLALTQLGAVPVPLYPPLRLGGPADYASRTAAMIESVGARHLITDRRLRRRLDGVLSACSASPRVLEVDDPVEVAVPETSSPVDPDEIALVQFSSGTTGSPRPVALSHRALLAQGRILNSFWPDTPGEPAHSGVSWLPLYHDMGLIGGLLPALLRPSRLTLLSPESFVARPAVWLRTLSEEKASVSAAPDFAYRLCVERVRDEDLEGVDLSHWRFALDGAEAVSAQTLRSFAERFAPWGFRAEALTPVYGLAEAALAVTFSDTESPFVARTYDRSALERGEAVPAEEGAEIVSVGRAVPHFDLEIRGPEGEALPERTLGSVWARGPSLLSEYVGQPEATSRVLRDGWMDTGDLGFLDEDQLFLCGRAKDVLVLHGRNVDPVWVETAAAGVDGVQWGGVVAVSWQIGSASGERLLVLAERRVGDDRDPDEIAGDVRRRVLAETGLRAERVLIFESGSLPRTSSGKNRRQAAAEALAAGRLVPLRSGTP